MTRITNVDQVLLQLRQQLQRLSRNAQSVHATKSGSTVPAIRRSALRRIVELDRFDDLTGEEFERALIRALLIDEFGEAVANEPKFQQLSNDVFRIISSDRPTRELLQRAARKAKENE